MSGRRRGVLAGSVRAALSLASRPYGLAVAIRNRRFDRDADAIHRVSVPVISVGNVTTGGTGKTPIVAWLAKRFRASGIRVSIVSRGYGRGDADQNDEAAELHQRLPDVPHLQDPDRVRSARIAAEELESQLILMDDGFQHRRLHRDLDIVLVDMTCPFGYGHLLPRGLLREPLRNLARADAVILTRCDQVQPSQIEAVKRALGDLDPGLIVVSSSHRVSGVLSYPDRIEAVDSLRDVRVAAVSGIGNPEAFQQSLRENGAILVASRQLPDHAAYDRETVKSLEQWIGDLEGVDEIICTHKDLVKLQTDRLGGRPLRALLIEAQIESTPEFEALLDRVERQVEGDVS